PRTRDTRDGRRTAHPWTKLSEPHRHRRAGRFERRAQPRYVGGPDPAFEEAGRVEAGFGLYVALHVPGPDLGVARLRVERAEAAEEGVVADPAPQHVQHQRAPVVDEGAENATVLLQVPA